MTTTISVVTVATVKLPLEGTSSGSKTHKNIPEIYLNNVTECYVTMKDPINKLCSPKHVEGSVYAQITTSHAEISKINFLVCF